MSKQIKISYKDKEYVLEYNRDSVSKMESLGFDINDLSGKIATNYPIIFRGAFLKNHKFAKQSEIDEIYSNIKNKKELMQALIEMITDCYLSLLEDNDNNDDEKNATWEIV